MFYHGIKREYVYKNFPVLSPRKEVSGKSGEQLKDRRHLLEQFGLEPIHLLEATADFPQERCVAECLAFGDTVFMFEHLPDPLWQLSCHEVGVAVLDLRQASRVYITSEDLLLRQLFSNVPFVLINM